MKIPLIKIVFCFSQIKSKVSSIHSTNAQWTNETIKTCDFKLVGSIDESKNKQYFPFFSTSQKLCHGRQMCQNH